MKILSYILSVSALVALSACGKPSKDSDFVPNQVVDTTNYQINGKTPKDYYSQFIYKSETTNGVTYFRYLSGDSLTLKDLGEEELRVQTDLKLEKKGTYRLKYEEQQGKVDNGGFIYRVTYATEFTGTWTTEKLGLSLSNLRLQIDGIKYNDRDAAYLCFKQDLHTAGLNEKCTFLHFTRSSSPWDN